MNIQLERNTGPMADPATLRALINVATAARSPDRAVQLVSGIPGLEAQKIGANVVVLDAYRLNKQRQLAIITA
jgi:hypothetical protein